MDAKKLAETIVTAKTTGGDCRARAYARKHGIETRFARPAQVKEYHAGATALLAHFHLCHNSSYPFSAAGD
ncbi:hypothetical protein VE03_10665, partial [Pseudogymnoascus sp. 23342-1-I1]